MTTYTATFHASHCYAVDNIRARTPQQALQKARALYDRDMIELDWRSYDEDCEPLEEITITGPDENAASRWQSDELLLQMAATDLFDALEELVERDRAAAAESGFSDDQMTWLEDARRALAKAKGGAS